MIIVFIIFTLQYFILFGLISGISAIITLSPNVPAAHKTNYCFVSSGTFGASGFSSSTNQRERF